MTQEQKAKAYDRVSKEVKDFFEGRQKMYSDVEQTLEYLFPELKESEDEKMKNAAIRACKYMINNFENSTKDYEDAIAWIEKQGEKNEDNPPFNDPKYLVGFDTGREVQKIFDEQKSVEWSEEDKENLYHVDALIKDSSLEVRRQEYLSNWLKSLKDRVQPQLKQEWSDEDKKLIDDTCHLINTLASGYGEKVTEPITLSGTQMIASIKDRLRALVDNRPQNAWKPSDEQIEALDFAVDCIVPDEFCFKRKVLKELLKQLKKLKDEK